MNKKTIILMLLAAAAVQAGAETYGYLTFETASGVQKSVSVTNLTLSYADGRIATAGSGATLNFNVADLNRMFFSTTSAGIETAIVDVAAEEGPVQAFNVSGAQVGTFSTVASAKASLAPGIYVLKSKSRTLKTVIR